MSMEMHVILKKAAIPTVAGWNRAIQEAGLPLVVPPGFDPVNDDGWRPFQLWDIASGVEVFFDPSLAEEVDLSSDLAPLRARFDSVLCFRWGGGDLNECAVAVLASATLAVAAHGVVYDPQEDLQLNGKQALASARQRLAELFPGR
jgi:hypothetical protein